MIGDNVDIDVLLPKRLGINTILLNRERKNVKCSAAAAVANSLKEAIEAIITINME